MKKPNKSMIHRLLAVFLALTMLELTAPQVMAATDGFRINILAVEKNNEILVEAVNFPADQTWDVRIGPYDGFFPNNVTVGQINAPAGGTFRFVVKLPELVQDVDLISLRLDSQNKQHVYNAFYNTTRGNVPNVGDGSGAIQIPVTGPTTPPVDSGEYACQMVSITLTSPVIMAPNTDFDVVWVVKNSGQAVMPATAIDFRYANGVSMQTNGSLFDLPQTIDPGESISLRVDMRSPSTTGIYTSNWALTRGSEAVCYLPVTIIVR